MNVVSIDQNSHSLWDTLPKLHALASAGINTTHYVEDIDVAFTAKGAGVDDTSLKIVQERFYSTGGSDWGDALFYNDFLGRVAVDIRRWENLPGVRLKQIAHDLNTTPQELFEKYSTSDNWMLVGSSFVGDRRHHRLIGDITVRQCRDAILWMFHRAKNDSLERFPSQQCRRRSEEWFSAEQARLERLVSRRSTGSLTELYADWLGEWLTIPDKCSSPAHERRIRQASDFFSLDCSPQRLKLAELFINDYERLGNLYNQAVATADVGVHPLDMTAGELPFYLIFRRDGRLVRCECRLQDGRITAGDMEFDASAGLPLVAMKHAGVLCIAGKAILLVLQVRAGQTGSYLALPYHGSMYMPAAYEFERLLTTEGVLPQKYFKPVLRVRFKLLDRLAKLDESVMINLPTHLAEIFGRDDMPAKEFAAEYNEVIAAARSRLTDFADETRRKSWMKTQFAAEYAEMAVIENRRRELAKTQPKCPEMRSLWENEKKLRVKTLAGWLNRLYLDSQAAAMDFYDSRGAILPWCIALGGEAFYKYVISHAEIYKESPAAT
ncbi:MAG TPA: hypothetical protein PKK48_06715 [Phycisphaerae bacterium]|nr:hypothetical protein [Phycisphaerae bacterium]